MSDEDKESKTEEASEKKLEQMREEGQVAQSHDVVSAAAMAGAVAALAMSTTKLAGDITALALRTFRLVDAHDPFAAVKTALNALIGVIPVFFCAAIAAAVAGIAQTKGMFNMSLAMPKFERLDPISKLKQMLPSKQMATELGKSLLKIGAVGWIMYREVMAALPMMVTLGSDDIRSSIGAVAAVSMRVLLYSTAAIVIIAAIDFAIALHKFNEDAKQTKQEQKEEHEQEEQDPMVKRKMRQRAREIVAQAKAGDLKTASVVVTNPTHYAVALRYDPEKDAVPMVIAKATDDAAMRMRKQARGYRIPIVENRPLARALHKNAKAGRPIPSDMYRAVAEIIAHVMRLKAGARS